MDQERAPGVSTADVDPVRWLVRHNRNMESEDTMDADAELKTTTCQWQLDPDDETKTKCGRVATHLFGNRGLCPTHAQAHDRKAMHTFGCGVYCTPIVKRRRCPTCTTSACEACERRRP